MMDGTDVIAGLGGLRDPVKAAVSGGLSAKDKVSLALQAHRGLFPSQPGMGGMSALGNAGLALAGMYGMK
jgi:hypothetical protein